MKEIDNEVMLQQLFPVMTISFLINDIARLLRHSFDRAVEKSGLEMTAGEARTLGYIATYEGLQQSVIAGHMGVEPMTLSVYINSLQEKGLISRTQKHDDRRAKLIHTTEKGKRAFSDICPIVSGIFEEAVAELSSDQVQTLEICVREMRKKLCLCK